MQQPSKQKKHLPSASKVSPESLLERLITAGEELVVVTSALTGPNSLVDQTRGRMWITETRTYCKLLVPRQIPGFKELKSTLLSAARSKVLSTQHIQCILHILRTLQQSYVYGFMPNSIINEDLDLRVQEKLLEGVQQTTNTVLAMNGAVIGMLVLKVHMNSWFHPAWPFWATVGCPPFSRHVSFYEADLRNQYCLSTSSGDLNPSVL